ncbi:MAG: lytic transglycosylase F [Desulfobacterales bacterium]|nr:lytic transglycosylase F [Desulfobacterales bacterium]MDX2512866.1 lytic transglycosylase F [Desulfobacterales bacterium]
MKKHGGIGSRLVFSLIITIGLILPTCVFGNEQFEASVMQSLNKKWMGDFEQMVERRTIRFLIPYSKTFYFFDKATQRGATYEMGKAFEKAINDQLKTRHLKLHVFFIPTSRERLIPALSEGLGDIAAGNLTITDKRMQQVDFCNPLTTGVSEVLVTGIGHPPVNTLSDLGGKEIHVRKSSSYHESLERVNKTLSAAGKPAIKIIEANEHLEDEDLLEMVNAGLIPMMVIDSHKGQFWAQIFEKIKLHPEIKFRENAKIAWAIRKNTPQLKNRINDFVKVNKKGTLIGNTIFNRYLKSTKYVKNNLADEDRKRFEETIPFFKKYGDIYGFDWLMLAARAYQESTIKQKKKSPAGAIGVMQVLPTTAGDKNVNISGIDEVEPNIHAGAKYLRFMIDRYYNDPGIDRLNRMLLAFASYNAGPAKISKLRNEAKSMNLDPNVWFNNVEVVAARRIGRETVQYVANILKYYIAYSFISNQKNGEDVLLK